MYTDFLPDLATAGLNGIHLSEVQRVDVKSVYRAVYSDKTSGRSHPGYLFCHHIFFTYAPPLTFTYCNSALIADLCGCMIPSEANPSLIDSALSTPFPIFQLWKITIDLSATQIVPVPVRRLSAQRIFAT